MVQPPTRGLRRGSSTGPIAETVPEPWPPPVKIVFVPSSDSTSDRRLETKTVPLEENAPSGGAPEGRGWIRQAGVLRPTSQRAVPKKGWKDGSGTDAIYLICNV